MSVAFELEAGHIRKDFKHRRERQREKETKRTKQASSWDSLKEAVSRSKSQRFKHSTATIRFGIANSHASVVAKQS